jgi:AhpD family alkylhydroperoxidase
LVGSLAAVEKEVIALASGQFADCIMNIDGI